MKKEDIVRKNMDLLNEFMRYAFDRPQVLDKIPNGAEVIILPLDDPDLMEENKKMMDVYVKAGKQVVLVKFRKPEPVSPELELVNAGV